MMKKQFRRLRDHVGGVRGLVFILYTTFIFSAYFFVSMDIPGFIRWTVFALILSAAGCPLLMRWLEKLEIPRGESRGILSAGERRKDRAAGLLFYLVPFAVFLIKYIACYPGGFSQDSVEQYTQALTGVYSDWHPFLQTILSFKVPLALTGGWTGSIILFQAAFLSAATGYALNVLREYTNRKYAFFALAFIALNPNISNIAMYPWKDVPFAIGAVVLTGYSLRIYYTGGAWLDRISNIILFIAAAALTTLMRHNALLFTVPLAAAVACHAGLKKSLVLFLGTALVVFGVKVPLSAALGVQDPGKRLAETMGVPMNIIGAAARYAPETLDDETLEFVNRTAPEDVWGLYTYGDYNPVKWYGADNDVIEEYGAARIVSMAWRCLLRNPNSSLKALIRLTEPIYAVCSDYTFQRIPSVDPNRYGIVKQGVPALQRINERYTDNANMIFPWLFDFPGAMHYALIALILAKNRLKQGKTRKKLLFVLPMFVFNYGTTLLLTSAYDSHRFFFCSFMITPLLAALVCDRRDYGRRTKEA